MKKQGSKYISTKWDAKDTYNIHKLWKLGYIHTHTHTHILDSIIHRHKGIRYINANIYMDSFVSIRIHTWYKHTCAHSILNPGLANGLGDWGSIPVRVIPKTQKMVLDTSLLNTQLNKIYIKGKVEQSRKRCSAFPYTSM